MQAEPGGNALTEDELGVLVPAARQRHDKGPGAPGSIRLGVPEQAAEAEVHLGVTGLFRPAMRPPPRRK
jgi:hypothetical protein